jgi:hypothetical protein
MSNTKHTPGPWTIDDIQEGSVTPENDILGVGWQYKTAWIKSGEIILAEVKAMTTHVFLHDFDEFSANTKLIAAAPELLQALKDMVASYKMYVKKHDQNEFIINAENAIQKAEGK